jgi:hypothetical protein
MGRGSATGYLYLQRQADTNQITGFSDNSNSIAGVRLDGARRVAGGWSVLYTAEYAQQNAYAGGDSRIDAPYSRFGLGAEWRKLSLRVDEERLRSNDGVYAFQTPLGSTHSFQGWADLFTTTPKQGIRDRYASLGASIRSVALYAEWHSFRSDVGDLDFGQELDVRVTWSLSRSLLLRAELADFRGAEPAAARPDTRKVWLTVVYNY